MLDPKSKAEEGMPPRLCSYLQILEESAALLSKRTKIKTRGQSLQEETLSASPEKGVHLGQPHFFLKVSHSYRQRARFWQRAG